eukprot:g19703.t1
MAQVQQLDKDLHKAYDELQKKNFEEQAIFWLNAFWDDWGKDNANTVWKWCKDFMAVDLDCWVLGGKKKQDYVIGASLNLTFSMKFMEKQKKVMTPVEYKKEFKTIDKNFDGEMSLIEWALHETKLSVEDLMSKPQATTPALEEAKKELERAKKALEDVQKRRDDLEIKAKTGSGLAALKARQEWEKAQQEDHMPLERAIIKAENNLKKQQKKVKAPPGQTWWTEKREAERAKTK